MDELLQMQIERFQDMNIGFEIVPNSEKAIDQKWENAFTKGISKSQKRKMTFKQCMWNVFSWGKMDCLKEQAAIDVFNQQKKKGCYLFYACEEEAIYIPKASHIKANDIIHARSPRDGSSNNEPVSTASVEDLIDLYIVDEDFTWTYVLTHEENCGPYFHKL